MRNDLVHADESLVMDAEEGRRIGDEEDARDPVAELAALLRRMPCGDAMARTLLDTISAEIVAASVELEIS